MQPLCMMDLISSSSSSSCHCRLLHTHSNEHIYTVHSIVRSSSSSCVFYLSWRTIFVPRLRFSLLIAIPSSAGRPLQSSAHALSRRATCMLFS